ncbi:MAG: sugar-binding transcriptional regulator [Bellilinea sp.]|jgi:DNA-binding transcriptional regulator LsrR (DeoR family)
MVRLEELRLVVRVARMYHEWGKKQSDIAEQLGLSQSTVSRLLNLAKEEGVIRISISVPPGVHTDLEEELVRRYQLRDAIVVDSSAGLDERIMEREVGAAAAYYLESVIRPNEVIGISSWSATLLAMVDAMHPLIHKNNIRVVQILGGVGNPSAEVHANRLTGRIAALVGGSAVYLPLPGVIGSEAGLQVLMEDTFVRETISLFDSVSLALVGIGALEPSKLLVESGNVFSLKELESLRANGAVGDVLLRFFDQAGNPVKTPLDARVASMKLDQLRKVQRSIGVACGERKHNAIRGALRGRYINILVTDHITAKWLLQE